MAEPIPQPACILPTPCFLSSNKEQRIAAAQAAAAHIHTTTAIAQAYSPRPLRSPCVKGGCWTLLCPKRPRKDGSSWDDTRAQQPACSHLARPAQPPLVTHAPVSVTTHPPSLSALPSCPSAGAATPRADVRGARCGGCGCGVTASSWPWVPSSGPSHATRRLRACMPASLTAWPTPAAGPGTALPSASSSFPLDPFERCRDPARPPLPPCRHHAQELSLPAANDITSCEP